MNDVILHVEDDPNDVELVGIAFRKAKVSGQVVVANDGDQAVDYLKGEGVYADRKAHPFPALMLLDIKLPRRSGLEVLEWLRSQPEAHLKRLPVVMLTSSNQAHDVGRAYDLGANSYLVKPGELSELIDLAKTLDTYWLSFNMRPPASLGATENSGSGVPSATSVGK
jgi:CheY-like chemotaxis protein